MKKTAIFLLILIFLNLFLYSEYHDNELIYEYRQDDWPSGINLTVRGEGYFQSNNPGHSLVIVEKSSAPIVVRISSETPYYSCGFLSASYSRLDGSDLMFFNTPYNVHNEIKLIIENDSVIAIADELSGGIVLPSVNSTSDEFKIGVSLYKGSDSGVGTELLWVMIINISIIENTPEGDITPYFDYDGNNYTNDDGDDAWNNGRNVFFLPDQVREYYLKHQVTKDPDLRDKYNFSLAEQINGGEYTEIITEQAYIGSSLSYLVQKVTPSMTEISEYSAKIRDEYGNLLWDESQELKFIPDSIPPSLEDVDTEYSVIPDSDLYTQKITVNIHDPSDISGEAGSGIDSCRLLIPIKNEEEIVESVDEIINGETIKCVKINSNEYDEDTGLATFEFNLERGIAYENVKLELKDRLGNLSLFSMDSHFISLVQKCQLDNTTTFINTPDEGNSFTPVLSYGVYVGASYAESMAGIESIYLVNKSETLGVPENYKKAEIYSSSGGGYAINPDPVEGISPPVYLLTGEVSVIPDGQSGTIPFIENWNTRGFLELDLEVELKLEGTDPEPLAEVMPLSKADIDVPVTSDINNVEIGIYDVSDQLLITYRTSPLSTDVRYWVNQDATVKIVNSAIVDNGSYFDINSDVLVLTDGDISGSQLEFMAEKSSVISLTEEAVDGDVTLQILDLGVDKTITKDDDFEFYLYSDTKKLESSNNYTNTWPDCLVFEDLGFSAWISRENGASGLKDIKVSLIKDGIVEGVLRTFPIEDYSIDTPVAGDESNEIEGENYYYLTLGNYPGNLVDGEYAIRVEVSDNAGNIWSGTGPGNPYDIAFNYDTVPVAVPDSLDGECNLFLNETGEAPVTGYSFVREGDSCTLELSLYTEYWENCLEGIEVTINVPVDFPLPESMNERMFNTSVITANALTFTIPLSDDFQSNMEYTGSLKIHDPAGNMTEHDMRIYMPPVLSESGMPENPESGYLEIVDDEYDDENSKFILEWNEDNRNGLAALNLYHQKSPENYALLDYDVQQSLFTHDRTGPGPEEYGLEAHETYTYQLRGVNNAGFESLVSDSITFDRTVKNNMPLIISLAYDTRYDDGGSYYMGPGTSVSITGSDLDPDTIQARMVLASDHSTYLFDFKPFEGNLFTYDYSDLPPGYKVEGSEIGLALEYQDTWIGQEAGEIESQFHPLDPFIYDSKGPVITEFTSDFRDGYAVSNYGFTLSVEDALSGEAQTTIEILGVTPADPVFEEIRSHSGEVHHELPESGNYNISVYTTDFLGNETGPKYEDLVVDRDAPEIGGARIEGAEPGTLYTSSLQVPCIVDWTDDFTGISSASVEIFKGDEKISDKEYSFVLPEIPFETTGNLSLAVPIPLNVITPADEITIKWKLYDYTGNESAGWIEIPDKVVVDMAAPAVTVDEGGLFIEVNGKRYIPDPAGLSGLIASVEEDNPTGDLSWHLSDEDSILYEGDLESLPGAVPGDGKCYLWVSADDKAGNTGLSDMIDFVVDSTAPVVGGEFETLSRIYHPGDGVIIKLSASEENVIADYKLWAGLIGTGEPDLSSLVEGNESGVVSIDPNRDEYLLEIPDVPEGRYVVKIGAEDICGNESDYKLLYDFELEIPGDYLTVKDAMRYSNSETTLWAEVEYHGEREVSFYRYRLMEEVPGQAPVEVTGWTDRVSSLLEAEAPSELEEGKRYFFQAEAQCGDGYWVESADSAGTVIDRINPEIEHFTVFPYMTGETLSIDWNILENRNIGTMSLEIVQYERDENDEFIIDEINGVEVYQKSLLETIVLTPETSGNGIQLTGQHLSGLVQGDRLEVRMTVSDLAGNRTGSENMPVVYDETPGEIPMVMDSGDYLNPVMDTLTFTMDGTAFDPESGICELKWQLLTGNGTVSENDADWLELVPDGEGNYTVSIPEAETPADGETAVLVVKAVNGGGLISFTYSDGIIMDTTKPYIARVRVNNGEKFTFEDSIPVETTSFDAVSTVEKVIARRVEYSGGSWTAFGEPLEITVGTASFDISLAGLGLSANEEFRFEFTVEDAVGNISLPYYSQGIYYQPDQPEIGELTGTFGEDAVEFRWTLGDGELPFAEHRVSLEYDGAEIAGETIPGGSIAWEAAVLSEGYYTFSIASISIAGSGTVKVKTILVDRTPPVVENLDVTPFVSDAIGISAGFHDELSYVSDWSFRIGLSGEPGSITGGWIQVNGITEVINEDILFAGLVNGGDILDKDNLLVEITAEDRFGNRSEIVQGNWALVDLTPPGDIEIGKDSNYIIFDDEIVEFDEHYMTRKTGIDGINLTAVDSESGVSGYRWYIDGSGGLPGENVPADLILTEPAFPTNLLNLTGLSFGGIEFINGTDYRIFFSFRNRAGVDSGWFGTPVIIADFSPPESDFQLTSGEAGWDAADDRPVVNGDAEALIEGTDQYSQAVVLDIALYNSGNTLLSESSAMVYRDAPLVTVPLSMPTDEWGIFLVEVTGEDIAGNRSDEPSRFYLRYNAPPVMGIPGRIETNPGRPFILDAAEWQLYDNDGVSSLEYRVTGNSYSETFTPGAGGVELSLLHNDPSDTSTVYQLECIAEDSLGQSESYASIIEVVNTKEGTLYVDETWSGTHNITGEVSVPPGITLTLAGETDVLCGGSSGTGIPPGSLTIKPGGFIVHQGSAEYRRSEGYSGYWNGIRLEGKGNFSGITIKDALRGLILAETSTPGILEYCTFNGNRIGLQVLKDGTLISSSRFENNLHYGIKEDEGASPSVINSTFANNGFDYYDGELTVLDAEGLNGLPGNSGNTVEGN